MVRRILIAVGRREPASALRSVADAFEAGTDAQQLLREASRLARAAALSGIGVASGADADPSDGEAVTAVAASAPTQFWIEALEILSASEMRLKQVADARLQVELCVLSLVCPTPQLGTGEIGALAKRVAALEACASNAEPPALGGGVGGTPAPLAALAGSSPGSELVPDPLPTEPAAPSDLATWLAAWPRFLEAMNQRDFMLAGLLKDCRPVSASAGGLVIGALHQFHLEQIRTEPKPQLLAEVAAEIAGHAVAVEMIFSGQENRKAAETEVAQATRQVLETFRGSRLVGSRPREPRGVASPDTDPGS
jgi:hypothetical protein